jgi:hypothetical protein
VGNGVFLKELEEKTGMKVLPVDLSQLQIALESGDGGLGLHAHWFFDALSEKVSESLVARMRTFARKAFKCELWGD